MDVGLQILLTDHRPGVGFNWSKTIGESLVIYTESAFRRGRDQLIVVNGEVTSPSSGWIPNSVIGSNYTFANALNLIIEYQHNGAGYSASEWRAIKTSTESTLLDIYGPGALSAFTLLGQYNNIIGHNPLRQNYAFVRFSHPNWLMDGESSVLWLKNLDDGSYVLRARWDKDFGNSYKFGIMAETLRGSSWSEFGIRPWEWSLVTDIAWYF
ncbi:hypothetical protein TI04_04125 [Achromatium sp. WMS2]|nr:hypothetical protein TI04_04125 [Achromatium sp. WMS2]